MPPASRGRRDAKGAPRLAAGRPVTSRANSCYQLLEPWQEFEQERVVASHPMVVVRFTTPFMWVAELVVVEL